MLTARYSVCLVLAAVWHCSSGAALSPALLALEDSPPVAVELASVPAAHPPAPALLSRAGVREGAPPPLCAGRCASPPAGPVCAFDATGTARTFATLCELEAVSCSESTYYAITSLGEC